MSDNDHAARVAAAFKALEQAWMEFGRHGRPELDGLVRDISSYLAARRAAREAGYVSVQLHKTTLEMVRDANDCFSAEDARERLWSEVRFLAAVLKPDGE